MITKIILYIIIITIYMPQAYAIEIGKEDVLKYNTDIAPLMTGETCIPNALARYDYFIKQNVTNIYLADIINIEENFYHAVVVYKDSEGYTFFNFYDTDILPGDWQMPMNSTITIVEVTQYETGENSFYTGNDIIKYIVNSFDADQNGIERNEAIHAVKLYFIGVIEKEYAMNTIIEYFNN